MFDVNNMISEMMSCNGKENVNTKNIASFGIQWSLPKISTMGLAFVACDARERKMMANDRLRRRWQINGLT